MKHTSPLRTALLALAMGLATLPTWADDDCDAPVARWQSREAVRQMATQQGWDVQRLKIDDGCYEVYGKDAQGRSFKAKVDPETLRVVKMKRRDKDRTASVPVTATAAPSVPRSLLPMARLPQPLLPLHLFSPLAPLCAGQVE
jgi:hypothetical protein